MMRGLGPFLRDAWRLALPYFRSEERWVARGLLAAVVALNLIAVALNVLLSYWSRAFYDAVQGKDWDSFINLLLLWKTTDGSVQIGFTPLALVFVTLAVYRIYLDQLLEIRWRRWLTERVLGDWFADRAYWRIALAAGSTTGYGTDNPDQRIAEDLKQFIGETLRLALGLLRSVVTLFSFVTILWTLSGAMEVFGIAIPGYMVWIAIAYALAASIATNHIGRPLAALNFVQQRVEADFRFGLARLRENMEGIALYGGEREEQRSALQRFTAVIVNWRQIMERTKLLTSVVSGFDQVAVIFPLVIAAPRYFAGAITFGALMQTTGAFRSVENALLWFAHFYDDLARWRATVERLTAFSRAIAAARAATTGIATTDGTTAGYTLDSATLNLPDGTPVQTDLTFAAAPGEWVAIAGRSGAGKSTLFRALAGIWPFGHGTVHRPPGRTLFLPQHPYLPLGTLRRVVTYPDAMDTHDDASVRTALHEVGLAHLDPLLDTEEPWSQRLSGGEKQRVAIARALLVKPDWLFLDEATASLDPRSEAELYTLLREKLPNAAIISIAHRTTVADLHERRLTLRNREEGGGLVPA